MDKVEVEFEVQVKELSKTPVESEEKTANPEEAPQTEKKSTTKIAPVKRSTVSLAERKE